MASSGDRRIAARLAAIVAVVFLIGCGGKLEQPCVVLVTLDTVRADHVGAWGDPSGRTPTLDAWSRRGAVVRDAIADVPLTLPSHVSIFTGLPALAHGVRLNEGTRLGEAAVTLAERFKERGFRTGAIVSSRVLSRDTGVAQGFEHYDDAVESPYEVVNPGLFPANAHWVPPAERRADRAVDLALRWLDGLPRGERFFLWVHLYDAHFPYDPPRPWVDVDESAYGGEVRSADRALRRLGRALEGFDRVVLAVVADHGEGLEDHGESEHGMFLYDETVRVPLFVSGAGVTAGRVLDAQARTIDLAATLLQLANDPSPGHGHGATLVAELSGERPASDRTAYSETILPRVSWGGAALKSIRTSASKYILAPRPERYDLRADPAERENLVPADEAAARADRSQLAAAVRELLAADAFLAEPAERSASDREALRALGYVGGASPAGAPRLEEELAVEGFDAKDLVDVVLAGRDVANGFHEAAQRKLRRFLEGPARRAVDPAPPQLVSLAHQNVATVAMAEGRFAEAAESYRIAITAEASNAEARSGVVYALNLAGRSRDAEREGGRLLAAGPETPKLRLHRALALALLGRREDARRELDRVAATTGDSAEAQVAREYSARLGTAEERAWLDAYLAAETSGR